MICRWAQELLGYQFTVIHQSCCMMVNVYTLIRQFGPLIVCHCLIANIFYTRDNYLRPLAYEASYFHTSATSKLTLPTMVFPISPVLSSDCMASFHVVEKLIHEPLQVPATASNTPINIPLLSTSPILFTTLWGYDMHTERADLVESEMKVTQVS